MISGNYSDLQACFGPDDDDNEKFENKSSKKCHFNPNYRESNKRINKKKGKGGYGSENLISEENSHTPSKSQKPEGHRRMSHDLETKVKNYKDLKFNYDIEYDFGNVEYKLKLTHTNNVRIEELVTQMKFRLQEGSGTCYYKIGLEDNGNPLGLNEEELKTSLDVLEEIAERLNATPSVVSVVRGKVGFIAEIVIKLNETTLSNKYEINIGLLGEYSSGKSTLIGVLISNRLDNGKGLARTSVFRHKHEILCGRTSTISHQILGFNDKKEITNYENIGNPSWAQIVERSEKIINFYDMGGSEKSFKSTMTNFSPDYVDFILLVIPAVSGISKNTEDFLNYSNSMKIPIITIFTKIDLISEEEIQDCIKLFRHTLKKYNINKDGIVIRNLEDSELFSKNIYEQIIPIFTISNLKAEGLNLFKKFLANLSKLPEKNQDKLICDEKLEFDIHETLVIENKVIVSGIVNKGIIKVNSKCYLGPYNDGSFKMVNISNIHCKKIPVKSVNKGQYCSIWIDSKEKIKRDDLRKGMVLLDAELKPIATRIFEADIWTIDGTRKCLKSKYQPVLNIKHIRQGCRIIEFKNKNEPNNLINNNDEIKQPENDSNALNIHKRNTLPNKNYNFQTKNNFFKSEIPVNNSHPLKNLPKLEELEHSNNLNVNKNIIQNQEISKSQLLKANEGEIKENNQNSENIANNKIDNIDSSVKDEISKIYNSNNHPPIGMNIDNKKVILGKEKTQAKLHIMDYNSDNNSKSNNKKNKKPKTLGKNKKSRTSQSKESGINLKNGFNSDKSVSKILPDQGDENEYENLKFKNIRINEEEDENYNEETYILSPNNNCTVVFEFMYYPEYITEEANILISDQLIKAHGVIKKLIK